MTVSRKNDCLLPGGPERGHRGGISPLKSNYKAGVWVGAGPDPAPLSGGRQNVLELRKSPGPPTPLSGCQGRAASALLLTAAPRNPGRAPLSEGGASFLFQALTALALGNWRGQQDPPNFFP